MKRMFSSIVPFDLRCGYKSNLSGIDNEGPFFSWIIKNDSFNSFQTAYQILISSSLKNLFSEFGNMWDSEKIYSSSSNQIRYSGNPLSSNRTYYWQVRIWNEGDEVSAWSRPANFSTGLLKKEEWTAHWISHIYCRKKKERISFVPGSGKWIWFPFENEKDKFKGVHLFKSFTIEDKSLIESAEVIVTADEKYRLFINETLISESDEKIFSWTRPSVIDVKDKIKAGENNLNADCFNSYVEQPGFLFRCEIKFINGESLVIQSDKSWKSSIESSPSKYMEANEVAAAGDKPWRLPESELRLNPAVYFKKNIEINRKVRRAFIYASALGLYTLIINNKKISDFRLTPGWSDFNKRVYYNTYDATGYLEQPGNNILQAILADGYYAGYCGWEKGRAYYGNYPALKLQLMLDYEDGSSDIIPTDESWESAEGPATEADILMGESYDASNYRGNLFRKVLIRNDVNPELTSYPGNEIKPGVELKAVSVMKIDHMKYIVDFSQNFAGFVRLNLDTSPGRRITLRFSEVLNEDESLYTDNLRMARATDTYIAKGVENEVWEPQFTYHGFRYVEISGLEEIKEETLTAVSINSLVEQTGRFDCSDVMLNKLYECILWNQRSNYIDIPTDCPQRDERFGWTGDAVSFFKTSAYNYDVAAFYSKWFTDLFDAQKPDGSLPPFAPLPEMGVGPVYFNSAGWADAGVITPYLFYQFYDDKKILHRYYPKMKMFLDKLEQLSNNYKLLEYGYGDWLSSGKETSRSFIATAYFAYDCFLMEKISRVLEQNEEAEYYKNLFMKIRLAFRNEYLDQDGQLKESTQTAAVLALYFNLLDQEEREKAANFLVQDIEEKDYHITTGFLGLTFLLPLLSTLNKNDIAWKILTNKTFPSWFFMIQNGATTLWERWDSYHPERGFFDPTMNSFNHCSLGCIGEWLYSDIGGIKAIEPGFRKIEIKPFLPQDLEYARTSFKSIYGVIRSEWTKSADGLEFVIKIPFNTSAFLILPGKDYKLSSQHKLIKIEDGLIYLEVGSGSFKIESTP
jgi:alpha-L-rhamnosidase